MAGDPTKAAFDSRYPIDQVIAIYDGTVTLANGASTTIPINTNNELQGWTSLFQGIWSIDGTNWYDIGGEILRPGTFVSDWTSSAHSNYGELDVFFWNVRSGATSTVQYKIAAISMGGSQPQVSPKVLDRLQQFDSRYNYQKIFQSNEENGDAFTEISIAPGGTYTYTVTHNFGFVPCARGFMEFRSIMGLFNSFGVYDMQRAAGFSFGSGGNTAAIKGFMTATTSTVTITITNTTTAGAGGTAIMRLFARVYYDF